MKKIVLATKNQDKVKEYRNIMATNNISFLSLDDFPDCPDVIEDGTTFAENALKKARTIYEFTGYLALADDTGLEVEKLNGRPGVYSARYAGEESNYQQNNQKLLTELLNVSYEQRAARFICCLVLYGKETNECAEGICPGIILSELRGSNGFGYDPLFYYEPLGKTFAEMSKDEKNSISHRARAFTKMKDILQKLQLN